MEVNDFCLMDFGILYLLSKLPSLRLQGSQVVTEFLRLRLLVLQFLRELVDFSLFGREQAGLFFFIVRQSLFDG